MASEQHMAYIGTRLVWGQEGFFGIRAEDRSRHLYAIGKTGTGKTTLLKNLIVQDINAGRGVGVIDPHGDLAESLLDLIPGWRTDDVVYFNPADEEHPVGLNLLDSTVAQHRYLIASGIVSAFKNVWRDSWGPRTEYILYAAVAALLDCENTSLLGIQRMLYDDRYRAWVVRQIKDPLVRSFWVREFGEYDERFMHEAVAPIQNKVGQLVMSPLIRNIVGQVRSRIDARFIIDNKQNTNTRTFSFLYECEHCGTAPKSYRCHHCERLVWLADKTDSELRGGDFITTGVEDKHCACRWIEKVPVAEESIADVERRKARKVAEMQADTSL